MKPLRILALMLALLSLAVVTQPAEATSVTPTAGPPGTRFVFLASGFKPRERLSFWLNLPDGRVQAANIADTDRSDRNGDAAWVWVAPADAAQGVWQMVSHGADSGFEVVLTFTIGAAPASEAPPPYGVDPRSGDAGTLFRFFATGFKAGEYVDVRVRSPGGAESTDGLRLAEPASTDGRLDGSWTSPLDAALGDWQVTLRGSDSGVTRTIAVTITAPTVARSSLVISPDLGSPGMRFAVSVTGFAANEDLSVWLNRPDGRVVAAEIEGTGRTAPDGRAGWTWVAPADAPLGSWQMVAHGRTSGIEAVVSFTLR